MHGPATSSTTTRWRSWSGPRRRTRAGRDDFGRERVTGDPDDRRRFKVPPLGNVELTAPYGHVGKFMTLRGFVEHYNNVDSTLYAYVITPVDPLRPTLLDNYDDILVTRDTVLVPIRLNEETIDNLIDGLLRGPFDADLPSKVNFSSLDATFNLEIPVSVVQPPDLRIEVEVSRTSSDGAVVVDTIKTKTAVPVRALPHPLDLTLVPVHFAGEDPDPTLTSRARNGPSRLEASSRKPSGKVRPCPRGARSPACRTVASASPCLER